MGIMITLPDDIAAQLQRRADALRNVSDDPDFDFASKKV